MAFVRWGVDWRLTVVILHHDHCQLLSFDVTCLKKLCVISIIWIKSCIFASQHFSGTMQTIPPLGEYPLTRPLPRGRGAVGFMKSIPPVGTQYILIPLPLGEVR